MTRSAEVRALLLLAAIHFVNLLDFMMVMPMGPDFAGALGIPLSKLGVIGGSYTAAATVVGLLGSLWLDRFERRAALACCVLGLGVSTMAAALATGYWTIIAARAAAGSFGGLTGTLCFSIVTDVIPEARRGRATAIVASGFAIASIAGVPAGLELSRRGGWRAPFLIVGILALLLAAAALILLPKLRAHMDSAWEAAPLPLDARVGWSFTAFGCAILGNFLIVPNISAYLQYNLGYPRPQLGLLYLFGGAASLMTMRLAGVLTDRSGAFLPTTAASICVSLALVAGFVPTPPWVPPAVFFTAFMAFNTARWVSISALSSRVPEPSARARYLSAQNAFSHAMSALSAFASTALLTSEPAGRLHGMPRLALGAALLGLGAPAAVRRLERLVGRPAPGKEEAGPAIS